MAENGGSSRRAGRTIVILGGGAAFGAHQAGALEYVTQSGIRPDAIIGSSVGILNALLFASGGCEQMRKAWLQLNSLRLLIGPSLVHNPVIGNSLMSMERTNRWLEKEIDFKAVFESPIELKFVLLNLSDGRAYLRGNRTEKNPDDFRTVAHIGYRIPGLYPPIKFQGDYWCDGGLVWNIPLEHAVEMGGRDIYVLSVIPHDLPHQDSFPTLAHVGYRLMEVMWATAGNSSRIRALFPPGGLYHGARVIDVQPSEYLGANPVSVLWSYPRKASRLMNMGRRDAERSMREFRARFGAVGTEQPGKGQEGEVNEI